MNSSHGRCLIMRYEFMVYISWFEFLKKMIYKAVGPLTSWKLNVDQEEWPCGKKWLCWVFKYKPKKGNFGKKWSLTILLTSFAYTCLHLSCHLGFSQFCLKKLCKYGRNRGEEEEASRATMIVYVFVHAFEECYGHLNTNFARRMGKICNFEHGLLYT